MRPSCAGTVDPCLGRTTEFDQLSLAPGRLGFQFPGAASAGSRILACGVPARAGAFCAEAHTVVCKKLRYFSASPTVSKSRSTTT